MQRAVACSSWIASSTAGPAAHRTTTGDEEITLERERLSDIRVWSAPPIGYPFSIAFAMVTMSGRDTLLLASQEVSAEPTVTDPPAPHR
jgi:hypothetical protein